jgi:hypothetical protein
MIDNIEKKNLKEKIETFDAIEIFVNEHKELVFEDIIDPVYIEMHFERVVNSSKDFDSVRMFGYHGKKSRELIAEVFVSKE